MEASRSILKVLKTSNSKRVLLAMELLEIASKNGDKQLHRYLSTTEYAKVFLRLLERKRGKGYFKHMADSKDTKRRWDSIEHMLLYLIQLWADTFIMHEDEYPGFQLAYR